MPGLNPSSVLLLDFYANHSLSITNLYLNISVFICTHGNRTPELVIPKSDDGHWR